LIDGDVAWLAGTRAVGGAAQFARRFGLATDEKSYPAIRWSAASTLPRTKAAAPLRRPP